MNKLSHSSTSSLFLCFVCSSLLSCTMLGQGMNNEKLEKIFYVVGDTVMGQAGNWQMTVKRVPMFCLTDEMNNRMRIISPVKELKDITAEEMKKCMEANFHSALDVKYCISEDILWVAFVHPLRELTKDQAIDAISQVYNATLTFGTTYSSTDLVFPKREEQVVPPSKKKAKPKKSRDLQPRRSAIPGRPHPAA